MTLPYRKKLIEVALPLEAINVASAREKSIRHGHPSTLHLWWARRPLAACRAVLFASLVDDPDSDPAFDAYKNPEDREHATGAKRQQLFDLITELVQWENSNNELVINAARAEIARCVASRKIETGELKKDLKLKGGETVWDLVVKGHGDLDQLRQGKARLPKAESVNAFLAEHAPPVLDPFAGGGSIPLEAQRLGLRAYASDLNPVPVLINKALIEIPPKFANMPPVNPESRKMMKLHDASVLKANKGKDGDAAWQTSAEHYSGAKGLAEDVRYYGKWMRDEAERRIGHLYPRIMVTGEMVKERADLKPYLGEGLTVIAWLWARTVASPNPAVEGAHVPLTRSFWLSKKTGKPVWIEPVISKNRMTYNLKIRVGPGIPPEGTIGGSGDRCLLTAAPISREYIRNEGRAGRIGVRLLAIVCEGRSERVYLPPTPEQEKIAIDVPFSDDAPQTDIEGDHRYLTPVTYGMTRHCDLFTPRQLCALTTMSCIIREVSGRITKDAAQNGLDSETSTRTADAVSTYLALAIGKGANLWSSLCSWMSDRGALRETFARQALPIVWDFAEANPLSDSGGNFSMFVDRIAATLDAVPCGILGVCQQRDATAPFDYPRGLAVSTDPPYYDNIIYADLSDYFYVWLRKSLSAQYPSLFATLLTPKAQEVVAAPHRHGGSRHKAQQFFENALGAAFSRICNGHSDEYPMTVFYAFKQSEGEDEEGSEQATPSVASTGWETMLEGILLAGFSVTGTWPMRTEGSGRIRNLGSNALASSILLVCRRRSTQAALATRREFLNSLKRELPDALKHLQRGNIAPVDLAQAAIGPGMAVFTRYAKVMEADGTPMKVRQALALINQTLDEVLAEQEGEFDGDTRWALAWFEQFGMEEGAFGIAETLSKAKNTAINGLAEAGLIKAKGGKVRLLKRDELPDDWDPATDPRLRHWEIVQHLIRTLDKSGEAAAAALLRKLGGMGEMARDLAYRLYSICERKKWASEALAYNTLVIAWPEITKLAQSAPKAAAGKEEGLF